MDEPVVRGTEVCIRCGLLRDVRVHDDGARACSSRETAVRAWTATFLADCFEHEWERTGCWFHRAGKTRSVTCHAVGDGHPLWEALRLMDDAYTRDLCRRFGELSIERQREIWHEQARRARDKPPRRLARELAAACGFDDLVRRWRE